MKRIQNFYLYSYRLVGFVFLVGLITSILWYGFSVLFFLSSSSWSVPMVLSADQEKVMTHLEHVLVLKHDIIKDRAELITFKNSIKNKQKLLKITQDLVSRFTQSISIQSSHYAKNSLLFTKLSQEKKAALTDLNKIVSQTQSREQVISQELKYGLITRQQALSEHIALSKIHTELIDAKLSLHELRERARNLSGLAGTLNGSANNLQAIEKVVRRSELESSLSQLKNDIYSLKVKSRHLVQNIREKKRVLDFINNSPYIRATKSPTTVVFAPYRNLKHVTIGTPVYSCYLEMILCYQSGRVIDIYAAEEYSQHPVFKSDIKGQLVGIDFFQPANSQKKLLFFNSKPLFF